MTEPELLAVLAQIAPELGARAPATRLAGGLLNETWRVPASFGTVVVKHAPAWIATAPEVSLDPSRLAFEARALTDLAPGGRLGRIASTQIRPPRPIVFDGDASLLVMEDLGDLPDIGAARYDPRHGAPLGRLIGELHASSLEVAELARDYQNLPIQRTRSRVQYAAVGPLLADAGVVDAETLGAAAVSLGERLLQPGRCVIMGDLWPPSVLIARDEELRVIDWELVHFGSPAQDLGHLAAHLWMAAHACAASSDTDAPRALWHAFVDAYLDAIAAVETTLLGPEVLRDAGVHMGSEILVRTVGPFSESSVYAPRSADDALIREANQLAAERIRLPPRTLEDLVA